MKPFLSIFLIFIGSSILNSTVDSNVKRLDSITSLQSNEIVALKTLLSDYVDFKNETEANDRSFMEFGSWITGIVVGLIILFGLIFNFVSERIIDKKFREEYDFHLRKFDQVISRCRLELSRTKVDRVTTHELQNQQPETVQEKINTSSIIENE